MVASMILRNTRGRRPGAQGAGGGPITLRIYRFLLVKINIEHFAKGLWECGGRPVGGALGPGWLQEVERSKSLLLYK